MQQLMYCIGVVKVELISVKHSETNFSYFSWFFIFLDSLPVVLSDLNYVNTLNVAVIC